MSKPGRWLMAVTTAAFFFLPALLWGADQNSDTSSTPDISQLKELAQQAGVGGSGGTEDLLQKASELTGSGSLEDLAQKAGGMNLGGLADLAQKAGILPKGIGGAPAENTSDVKMVDKETYLLRGGDKLTIKIFPEDPYIKGGEVQVSPEGNVTLPLMGKVPLAGKSVSEAQLVIQQILDRDYLVNPEVTIEVMETKQKAADRSFVFLGQVKKPGTYQFPEGAAKFSLLEAISLAGGFSDIANIKKIKILRPQSNTNVKKILHANADAIISGHDPDIEIEEGDVISVSETLF